VLGIWEHINHRELRDQRKAAFLASKALYDLTAYETGRLTQIAEQLYQARGTLLLNDWAAECASPGITSLAPVEPRYLNAITALSFLAADSALVTRLITHAAGPAGRPEKHENGAEVVARPAVRPGPDPAG